MMVVSSSKGSTTGAGRSLLWLTGCLALTVLYQLGSSPFPEEINGWGPKLEYHRQLLLHLTGLASDWDVPSLSAAYAGHLASKGISMPDVSNRTTAYHLDPLPELDPATDPQWQDKLQERVSKGQSIVVRGLMYHESKTFPHAKMWNIEYLKEKVFPKGTTVPVFTDVMNDRSVIMHDFHSYVDGLRNKSRKWYARCLDDKNLVIKSGFNASRVAELMGKTSEHSATNALNAGQGYCCFVGSTQVNTRMHSDTTTSAFLMMQGRKRWILFPPTQSAYVLPFGHELNVAYNSRVNMFASKEEILREYPYMGFARGHEVIINPGDVLFFSSFNWHGVQNLDDITIGVDFPVFDPVGSYRRNTPLMLGTYGNLMAVWKVLKGFVQGKHGLKQAFFEGYNLGDGEAEAVKKANGA